MSGMQIRQSDLASFNYCAQQLKLNRAAEARGRPRPVLSATARGTVIHHALQMMGKLHHEGREDALSVAKATFDYYWEPDKVPELVGGPIDAWIGKDTWVGLKSQSHRALEGAYDFLQKEDKRSVLLALEHSFWVPIEIDGEWHTLHGTVDRLALRTYYKRPYLSIDDWKSGREATYLDWETQWTLYAYASQHPAFWSDFTDSEGFQEIEQRLIDRGVQLYNSPDDLPLIGRRGRWLSVRDGFKERDCGWRGEEHYSRLKAQLREYIKAVRADIYPLTVNGHVCNYCPWGRSGECGDAPLPERQDGIE